MVTKLLYVGLATFSQVSHAQLDVNLFQSLILTQHNTYRRSGKPVEAANMQRLQWDSYLASEANRVASKCIFAHEVKNYGQNIWMTSKRSPDSSISSDSLRAWVDNELSSEPPSLSTKTLGIGVYNHASAVLWADSNKVGCAYKVCPQGTLLFCNYAPAGNMVGRGWYALGKKCSACPSSAPYCDNGLCSAVKTSTGSEAAATSVKATATSVKVVANKTKIIDVQPAAYGTPSTTAPKTPLPTKSVTTPAPLSPVTPAPTTPPTPVTPAPTAALPIIETPVINAYGPSASPNSPSANGPAATPSSPSAYGTSSTPSQTSALEVNSIPGSTSENTTGAKSESPTAPDLSNRSFLPTDAATTGFNSTAVPVTTTNKSPESPPEHAQHQMC